MHVAFPPSAPAHLILAVLDVSDASELQDYLDDGYGVADWLHDQCVACQTCQGRFTDAARDGRDDGEGWTCEACLPEADDW